MCHPTDVTPLPARADGVGRKLENILVVFEDVDDSTAALMIDMPTDSELWSKDDLLIDGSGVEGGGAVRQSDCCFLGW